MRLHPDHAALLRGCENRAIAENKHGSSIDHAAARRTLHDLLVDYERIGHSWPAQVIDDAINEGLGKRIKARIKAERIPVSRAAGSVVQMPVAYSDGEQLSFWLWLSLEDLEELIASITSQASILADRVEILNFVRALIVKHGAANGDAALRAEGLDPSAFTIGDAA